MSNQPNSSSASSAREKVAKFMRLGGWACFWSQLALAVISALILVFALFSLGESNTNAGSGGSLFFAGLGLAALGFSIFLAFRYPQLARKLRSPTPSLRPTKADTTQQVRMALIANMTGMFLTLLGAESFSGILLAKSLSQPQGLIQTTGNVRDFIEPLDIFLVLGNTHTIFAHFVGIAVALWLLNEIHK
ncbi:MAG: DUF3611 family protein [Okeania sp. SIO2H7]|nr:DUF3611 family protein [Okeania sp. SIO2H7]